jgi:hypothetical protein
MTLPRILWLAKSEARVCFVCVRVGHSKGDHILCTQFDNEIYRRKKHAPLPLLWCSVCLLIVFVYTRRRAECVCVCGGGGLHFLFQIINRLLRLRSNSFLSNCLNVGKNCIEVATRVHHLVEGAKLKKTITPVNVWSHDVSLDLDKRMCDKYAGRRTLQESVRRDLNAAATLL